MARTSRQDPGRAPRVDALRSQIDAIEAQRESLRMRLDFLHGELERLVDRIEARLPAQPAPPAPVPEPDIAVAPPLPPEDVEADKLVRTIDEELGRIDLLLASLARREQQLRRDGFPDVGAPARAEEFTLYARPVKTEGGAMRAEYFFSEETPWDAYPVPVPEDYRVQSDPRTGERSLKPRK